MFWIVSITVGILLVFVNARVAYWRWKLAEQKRRNEELYRYVRSNYQSVYIWQGVMTMDQAINQLKNESTSFYEYIRWDGDLPIRLKNQQPPKRRLADFL